MKDKYLVVIAGPTASGKTATAIKVAKALGTEIISADSRQFYKELPIGTAAPTPEDQAEVQHHMIHNLNVEDKYDVADYEQDVLDLLEKLFVKDLILFRIFLMKLEIKLMSCTRKVV